MRISRVRIDNYRNLRHVDVELGNIVALIGENNSGKSNFLRALSIPLSSDDTGTTKRLSWFDINKDAKKKYYEFLKVNRSSVIDGSLKGEDFLPQIPTVTIQMDITPDTTEHYDVKDILVDEDRKQKDACSSCPQIWLRISSVRRLRTIKPVICYMSH